MASKAPDPEVQSLPRVRDAIAYLSNPDLIPPEWTHLNQSDLINAITSSSYDTGLGASNLSRVVDLIIRYPRVIQQSSSTRLIKNLYPASKVPSSVVSRIICSLGPTKVKPAPAVQALLLRWLILIYDELEEPAILSKLYAVLFNHLEMISLRRPLCQLLSLVTRRQHVRPFRIQALMELLRDVGDSEKELIGLVKVYKNHYPDIILGDVGGTVRGGYFFKHPDPEWSERLAVIREVNASQESGKKDKTAAASSFKVVRRGGFKRTRKEVIPEVQTSRVHETSTTLEDILSVDDFVARLEKIELPNQMVAVLQDPLAQKYLSLTSSRNARSRLENWLESYFADVMERQEDFEISADEPTQEEMVELKTVLQAVLGYARYSKQLPIFLQRFLQRLSDFGGITLGDDAALSLLEFVPILPFADLKQQYFDRLEELISYGILSPVRLLQLCTSVIRHWNFLAEEKLSNLPESFNTASLQPLVSFSELLSLSVIETNGQQDEEDTHTLTSATISILDFYTTLSALYTLSSKTPSVRISVPSKHIVNLLILSPTLPTISILSSILARYKTAFEASKTAFEESRSQIKAYPESEIVKFNGYIMDLCNLLWRNRALNKADANAQGCSLETITIETLKGYIDEIASSALATSFAKQYTLASTFSLSHHPVLALASAKCVQGLEDEKFGDGQGVRLEAPATQRALAALERKGGLGISWQDYRVEMLKWLEERGVNGIGELMRGTMKDLRSGGK